MSEVTLSPFALRLSAAVGPAGAEAACAEAQAHADEVLARMEGDGRFRNDDPRENTVALLTLRVLGETLAQTAADAAVRASDGQDLGDLEDLQREPPAEAVQALPEPPTVWLERLAGPGELLVGGVGEWSCRLTGRGWTHEAGALPPGVSEELAGRLLGSLGAWAVAVGLVARSQNTTGRPGPWRFDVDVAALSGPGW